MPECEIHTRARPKNRENHVRKLRERQHQVDRGGCEIILCEHDARRDKARLFVSLTSEAIGALRREIAAEPVNDIETPRST